MASTAGPPVDYSNLNLGDFNYRQRLVLGVTITILMLAIISYALRLYAKRITAASVWWDDYMIGVGLVSIDRVKAKRDNSRPMRNQLVSLG